MKNIIVFILLGFACLVNAQEVDFQVKSTWNPSDMNYSYALELDKKISSIALVGATLNTIYPKDTTVFYQNYYIAPNACNKPVFNLINVDKNGEFDNYYPINLTRPIEDEMDAVGFAMCQMLPAKKQMTVELEDTWHIDSFKHKISLTMDGTVIHVPMFRAKLKTVDFNKSTTYYTSYHIAPKSCGKKEAFLLTTNSTSEISSTIQVDFLAPKSKEDSIAVKMCETLKNIQ